LEAAYFSSGRAAGQADKIVVPREEKAKIKFCPQCESYLPTSSFRPDKNASTGIYKYCRECDNFKRRIREYKSQIKHQANLQETLCFFNS
jgi:Pyruvate/2-oxoacid:ferredoxin oxidoreductase delta subunit